MLRGKKAQGPTYGETIMVLVLITFLISIAVVPLNRGYESHGTQNLKLCAQIKTAISTYLSDYSSLPIPPNCTEEDGIAYLGIEPGKPPTELLPGTAAFFQALCGNINASTGAHVQTGLNERNTPYLELRKSEVDAQGVPIQGFLYNGKSAYFSIAMDAAYTGKIKAVPDFKKRNFSATVDDCAVVWCCNDEPCETPNLRWARSW